MVWGYSFGVCLFVCFCFQDFGYWSPWRGRCGLISNTFFLVLGWNFCEGIDIFTENGGFLIFVSLASNGNCVT